MNKEGYLEEPYHFFHLKDTAGQERDYHFHEFDKVVILISGKVDYAVESEVYPLHPGDVLLVPHHAIHKAVIDKSEPYDRVIVYLSDSRYSSIMPDADLTACFARADEARQYRLSPAESTYSEIREIIAGYEAGAGRSAALRETFILRLLAVINEAFTAVTAQAGPVYDEKIERVLSYINENLSRRLDVEELAEQVYLSRYHFMRLFKSVTGISAHAYVRQRRLMYASRLIREGTSAAEAARMSGFEDYSSFYRAFRSSFGINPGDLKSELPRI